MLRRGHCFGWRALGLRWTSTSEATAPRKVPIELIKQLRSESGCTVIHAKLALTESDGDLGKAREVLREKFQKQFTKRQNSASSEGMVMAKISQDMGKAALLKLCCETDFVARTDEFLGIIKSACNRVLEKPYSPEELGEACHDEIRDAVGTLGEAIRVDDVLRIEAEPSSSVLSSYVHNTVQPGIGRIGAVVALDSSEVVDDVKRERLKEFGKHVAMQIAAMAPTYISAHDISPETRREHTAERTLFLRESGREKKEAETEALRETLKWIEDSTLLEQQFIMEDQGHDKVKGAIDALTNELGSVIRVKEFSRFAI
ncbi:hypothetical protein NDN08_007800 [Rhodosorus marinus]|uniref:Elongation factor Ts, mitochondrial n=1 Tax=Rhodosorus marinus TaxID=101924 RepID=A0AAV8V1D7_9RHOD|nr:hypothetical protein NDN08_007800 [Rhodosorus marinus]